MEYQNGLNGAGIQAEDPLMGLMRAYVQAKHEFDEACQVYAQVSQRKVIAEKQLHELSEKVAGVIQQGVYDPTCPQPAMQTGAQAGAANGSAFAAPQVPRY